MADTFTIAHAAARTGIGERELRRALEQGRIQEAGRQGRSRLVTLEAVAAYQAERAVHPPRRGRPPTVPTPLDDAIARFQSEVSTAWRLDKQRRVARLVDAFRAASVDIAELDANPAALPISAALAELRFA